MDIGNRIIHLIDLVYPELQEGFRQKLKHSLDVWLITRGSHIDK
jgi:hypothetical protein